MGLLDSIGSFFSGGADESAKKAATYQANAADKQTKYAKEYQSSSTQDTNNAVQQALDKLDNAEGKALEYRKDAGEALGAAEEQALAQYEASKQEALQVISQATGKSIDELTSGESNALNELQAGRVASLNALYGAQGQSIGALDTAEQTGVGALNTAYSRGTENLSPYTSSGAAAQQQLADLQGLNGPEAQAAARAKFQTDPGYAFRLEQGLKAGQGLANAQGNIYSGATLKALNDYAQGQASQEYGNYYNRTQDIASRGQEAATQLSQMAQALGISEAELRARLGIEKSGVYQHTGDQVAGVEQSTAQNRANARQTASTNRANVYQNEGQQQSDVISNFGKYAGDTMWDSGKAYADVLTGAADQSYKTGQDKAGVYQWGSGQRNTVRANALDAYTSAAAGKGNAMASGEVGAAKARQQGLSNFLTVLGGVGSFFGSRRQDQRIT